MKERIRDLARTIRKRDIHGAFNAAFNEGRIYASPENCPNETDETGTTAKQYRRRYQESERRIKRLCDLILAEPARKEARKIGAKRD